MVLVAAMVDLYLKEIGRGFLNKLGRGRNTGLQPPLTILLPWQVFTHLSKLVCKYGGCCECKDKKNKEKLFTISISSEACARKIWHPMQIGKSYLEGGVAIQKSHFCGVAKIVVCHNTPITISYYTKTQKCSTTFWIQRYNLDMMGMDALVQAKMNE